jgi:hypothetical protein
MVGLGDEYVLAPFASNDMQVTESAALARIVAVYDLYSEAEMRQAPRNRPTVSKGWHASLHRPCKERARVILSGQEDQDLDAMIAQSPWLERVDHIEATPSTPAFNVVIEENATNIIHLGTGEEIRHRPLDVSPENHRHKRLVTVLEHLAKFAAIEGLGNDTCGTLVSPEFNSSFEAKDTLSKSAPEFSISFGSKAQDIPEISNNVITIHDGDILPIKFENHTRQSLFLTIFNLTPLRKVSQIYPSSDRGRYKEIPPQSADFTGKVAFRMTMSIPGILKSEIMEEVEDILMFFITTRPVSSLSDALWLPELSQDGLVKDRSPSSEDALADLLEDPVSFCSPSRTWRSERGRWTCADYLVRTQRKRS